MNAMVVGCFYRVGEGESEITDSQAHEVSKSANSTTVNWCTKLGIVTLLLAASACASAGERAELRNGFSLRIERHEVRGAVTRLYLDARSSNFIDVSSEQIASFEPEDDPPLVAPAAAQAPAPAATGSVDEAVRAASAQHHVDPDFVHSVIRVESGGNPRAVSPKGAQGLMQIMPATAAQLGLSHPFEPAANVEAGTRYLRQLLLKYHGDPVKVLAAYNAGPERVARYGGLPPFPETQAYVARVIRDFNRRKAARQKPPMPACTKTPVSKSQPAISRFQSGKAAKHPLSPHL
jgi:soluble lytic murein transglycosylase-like protein